MIYHITHRIIALIKICTAMKNWESQLNCDRKLRIINPSLYSRSYLCGEYSCTASIPCVSIGFLFQLAVERMEGRKQVNPILSLRRRSLEHNAFQMKRDISTFHVFSSSQFELELRGSHDMSSVLSWKIDIIFVIMPHSIIL